MRLRLRSAGLLALAVVAITCTDSTSPNGRNGTSRGVLAMAPSFSASAARIYKSLSQFGSKGTVSEVHVHMIAPPPDTTVRDTVILFPADQDSLVMQLPVPATSLGEAFSVLLELRNDQHTVLFSGTQTIVAQVDIPGITTPAVVVQYTGPGHKVKTVSVSPPDTSVSTVTPLPYTATALDSAGHPVTDLLVQWASSDATVATVASVGDAAATVTPTGKRGTTTISATTPALIASSSKLTFVPVPSKVVVVTGGAQTGAVGTVLAQPLVVEVDASDNLPVTGATVNFSAVTTGGAVQTASAVTDANGRVSTTMTLGHTSGAYQFQATSGTLTAAVATETATPGAAASIAKSAGDAQSATVATAVSVAPRVVVKDAFSNVVPNASVTFAVASGGGSVTAATATTDASGLAAVGSWTLGNTAGPNTLAATTGTFSTTFTATGTAGAATKFAFVQAPPATITVGVANPAVTARLVDAFNNPVALAGVVVTLRAISTPSNDSLVATATTDATGLATYVTPVYIGAVGTATVTLSATGYTPLVSSTIQVLAGTAAQLVVRTQPSATVASGVALGTQPIVQVADVGANAVSSSGVGVTASIGTGGGTLGGTTTTLTDANGKATFTDLAITGTVGPRTLVFAKTGLTSATSASITVTAGAPASITKSAGDAQTAAAGTAVSVAPKVLVKDAAGNVVPNAAVVFAVASGGGSVTGANATTDAFGLASVGSWTLGNAAGSNTLSATTGSFSTTFSATGVPGTGSKFAFVQLPASITVGGGTTTVTARLLDALNNPVALAGVSVTLSGTFSPGNVTTAAVTATTDATGLVTFSFPSYVGPVGTISATVSAPSYTALTSPAIPVLTGAPALLVITTQPAAAAASGAPFTIQPVIQVTDAGANVVSTAGLGVTAAIASGSGTLGGKTTVQTDATGKAFFADLSISGSTGTRTLGFTGLNGATPFGSVTSSAIAVGAGSATTIGLVNGSSGLTATVNTAVVVAPRAIVTDASGNAVAGVVVTFNVTTGTGGSTVSNGVTTAASNVTVTTNASGVAQLTTWTMGSVAQGYQVNATVSGLTGSPVVFLATAIPSGGTQLAFATQPSATGQSGSALAAQPVIQLKDASGNAVTTPGVVVTAAIASGTGSLTSATATTDATGKATFGGLTITGTAGNFTLQFGASGYANLASGTIAIGAGTPTKLVVITQPSATAASGATFATQPVVQLADPSSNPAAGAGVSVTASIATGAGTLGGTTTVLTDASGKATFTDLVITGAVGSRTLAFASTGLTSATSTAITVTAGSATSITINTGNSQTATAGSAVSIAPKVLVKDAAGNGVPNASVVFAVASGGGSVTGASATTDASGFASVGSWTLGNTAGANTLSATSGSFSTTFSATGTAGVGSNFVFVQVPANIVNGPAATVTSQLTDALGNSVAQSGVLLTLTTTLLPNNTVVGSVTATTDATGLATFSISGLYGLVGATFRVTVSAPGYASLASSPIGFLVGPAAAIFITTQPSATVVSGAAFATQPVVQLVDRGGNPVQTAGMSISTHLASGSVALGGTQTVTTDANGTGTFTDLVITGATGSRTLAFTSTGLNSATSTSISVAAGPAASIAINAGDGQTATVGTAVGVAPSVKVTDASANPVSGTVVTFNVVTGAGGSTVSNGTTTAASATVTTNASGIAQLAQWTLGSIAQQYQVNATATGLTGSPITFSATGTVGVGTQLAFVTAPSATASSGAAIGTQPVIQLEDAFGNSVTTSGVVVTATIASGAGSLTSATATTDVTGKATFSGLTISGTAGNFTLRFDASGYSTLTSGTIALGAGAPAALAIITQPSSTLTTASAFATQPVVRILDANNNLTTGTNAVTATLVGGEGSLFGTTTVNAVNGVATFTNLGVNGPGSYTLSFSSSGLTTANSNSFTVAPQGITLALGTAASVNGTNGVNLAIPIVADMTNASGQVLAALTFNVTWDPAKFDFVGTTNGSFGGSPSYTVNPNNTASGTLAVSVFDNNGFSTGAPTIFTVTLLPKASATNSPVTATVSAAGSDVGNSIPNSFFTIRPVAVTVP